jgi:hypothetical protein
MDYLPIQPSAVSCESIFSSSAETDVKKCNRIHPILMEALQMMKFLIKKGSINLAQYKVISEKKLVRNNNTDNTLAVFLSMARVNVNTAMAHAINRIVSDEGDDATDPIPLP